MNRPVNEKTIKVTVIDDTENVVTYDLAEAPTILIAFENAGYQYPHGCRVGVCGSCISEVVHGMAHLPTPDFVEKTRLEELRSEERKNGSASLDGDCIRFCCRTSLTDAGPITLRPLSGSVGKLLP